MRFKKTYVKWFVLISLVSLIYGAGLKMFPAGFDEIRFLREIDLSFVDYLRLASHDNSNTPAMHAINWIAARVMGPEIWHLRLVSFIFMAVAILYFFHKIHIFWPENKYNGWVGACFLLLSYPFIFYSHWAANAYALYVLADVLLLFFTIEVSSGRQRIDTIKAVPVFLVSGLPHYSMIITWGCAVLLMFLKLSKSIGGGVAGKSRLIFKFRYALITPAILMLQFIAFTPGALLNNARKDIGAGYLQDYSLLPILRFCLMKIKNLLEISTLTLQPTAITWMTIFFIFLGIYFVFLYRNYNPIDRSLLAFWALHLGFLLFFAILKLHPLRSKYFPIFILFNAVFLERMSGLVGSQFLPKWPILKNLENVVIAGLILLTGLIGAFKYIKYADNYRQNQQVINSIANLKKPEIIVDEMALVILAFHLQQSYENFRVLPKNSKNQVKFDFIEDEVVCCFYTRLTGTEIHHRRIRDWQNENSEYRLVSRTAFADSSLLIAYFQKSQH